MEKLEESITEQTTSDEIAHLACPLCEPVSTVCGIFHEKNNVLSDGYDDADLCVVCDDSVPRLLYMIKHDKCYQMWKEINGIAA